jgi:hypothetical protein
MNEMSDAEQTAPAKNDWTPPREEYIMEEVLGCNESQQQLR